MKKLILITGVVLIAYLAFVTLLAPVPDAPEQSAPQPTATEETGYRIGILDGRVAIFHDGSLYLKTDTAVADLPKSDRVRLTEGVSVSSLSDLKRLLQDYCS